LGMTRHIPDDYTLVEICSNTDPDHYLEFLQRQSDRYQQVCFVEKQEKCEKTGKTRFHRYLLNGVDL